MNPNFSGDVVLVTGAAGGMGRAVSVAFARAGAAAVVLADVAAGDETVRSTTEAATAIDFDSLHVVTDVSEPTAVADLISTLLVRFGRLDHAVNAAAIENESVPLHECDVDDFDRMQAVNLRGLFLCMKHEITAMLRNEPESGGSRGTIVNIASTNSFRPQPNQPAYTASKHAVLGLTRSAAIDYAGRGIRVNAICPGSIDTPMLRQAMERRGRNPTEVVDRLSLIGRFGTPDEIADAVLWLCSDNSSFTMGHALAVDAGYLAR